MATSTTSPVNLIAGSSTSVVPAGFSDIGNAVAAVIVFNSTSQLLLVQSVSGSSFLQPNTADVFDCTSVQAAPILTPITSIASGIYVGTVTAEFLYAGDDVPRNYPVPLVPFPGGSSFVVAPNPGQQYFNMGAVPGAVAGPLSIDIQPPSGTGSLTFTGLTSYTNGGYLTLKGDQSGHTYYSLTYSTAHNYGTLSIPVGGYGDTSYTVTISGTTGPYAFFSGLYASPLPYGYIEQYPGSTFTIATTVPSVPNLVASGNSNGTIISAPSSGSWYLFGADAYNAGAIEFACVIEAGGSIIGLLGFSDTAGQASADHCNLNGFQTTLAVSLGYASGSGILVVLRYAAGP